MSQHRNQVLRAYRELLSLVKRLPEAQRGKAWEEARAALRAGAAEASEERQQELFKQLATRISFLRTITPRRAGEALAIGAGHYVMRDGKLVEGSGQTAGTRCAWRGRPAGWPGPGAGAAHCGPLSARLGVGSSKRAHGLVVAHWGQPCRLSSPPSPLPAGVPARSVADGSMSMDEARQRHQQLLKRQHFGRDPLPYNPASF